MISKFSWKQEENAQNENALLMHALILVYQHTKVLNHVKALSALELRKQY